MNQYSFSGKLKPISIGLMILGALCLGLTWFSNEDGTHARFWSNLLHNGVFFMGISAMATFFIAVCVTAYAGWHTVFKRVWEAFSAFMVPGTVIMILIAIATFMHGHHMYHWTDESLLDPNNPAYDPIIAGKSGFLNKWWYLIGTIVVLGAWSFFAYKFRQISREEDINGGDENFTHHRTLRKYSAIFLPIFGFTSCAMIWQWVMSVDAHWYSTMFAWYSLASLFVSMIALTILSIIYLRAQGYFANISQHHVHDLGKFLFAFSIFWTYLWFSQFMLIWYANVGEETIYFRERYDNYPILFFGNLIVNFALPFLVLLRNDTKWKIGSLSFIAILVFIGHWVDFFLMIKPGVLHTAHAAHGGGDHGHGDAGHAAGDAHSGADHAVEHVSTFVDGFTLPGLLELGTMLGFLGLFAFVVFNALQKAPLLPKNDPYLEESLHHHV